MGWQQGAPVQGWQSGAPVHQSAPAHPNGWMDAAKSLGSGIVSGFSSLADTIANPARAGVQLGMSLANPHAAQAVAPYLGSPISDSANAHYGAAYQPQTTTGRYAKSIGENVPNAFLGPETHVPRAAAVVLPRLLGQGGADLAQAAGGGPQAQGVGRLAGGLLGGSVAGFAGAHGGLPAAAIDSTEQPVANAVGKALALGQSTPADVHAGMQQGLLPVATSPGLAGLGEAVASTPGPAGVMLKHAIAERMGSQTDRALGAVQTHLGVDPDAARGNIDSIVAAGQKAAGPLYDAVRNHEGPVWNSSLAELAQRPAVKKAMDLAVNGMLNRGQNPRQIGFALDPDTGWGIASQTNPEAGVAEQQPTAELWDRTYKALGQTVDRNQITNRPVPNSLSPNNTDIAAAGGDLKSALVNAVPAYGDALKTSSDYLSVQNAFDRASGKLFTGNVANFGKLWDSLQTEPERQAARSGLANEVLEVADRNQNGINPGRFRAPGVQKKLSIAFGDQGAQSFVEQMESDANEKATYNTIVNNSRSTPRAALIAEFAKDAKPKGLLGKGLGLLEWGQAVMHPPLLMTKIARAGLNRATGAGAGGTLPWDDPATAAQLGGVLSDPVKMQGLLGRMTQQKASLAQIAATKRMGLLQGVRYAAPTVSGLLAPAPNAAAPGYPPQP